VNCVSRGFTVPTMSRFIWEERADIVAAMDDGGIDRHQMSVKILSRSRSARFELKENACARGTF